VELKNVFMKKNEYTCFSFTSAHLFPITSVFVMKNAWIGVLYTHSFWDTRMYLKWKRQDDLLTPLNSTREDASRLPSRLKKHVESYTDSD